MTRRRTVLVIVYAWPPAGGAGVQRVLKFVKYLPEFGFRPVVLTVSGGTYPALDPTLEQDVPPGTPVYRSRILEPSTLYRRAVGMRDDEPIPVAVLSEPTRDVRRRLAHFVRLNLFVPDAKIGWLPFGFTEGSRIIRREQPEVIFSSSPPPTTHLVAQTLVRRFRLPWVADFRDPWTEVHFYDGHRRLAASRALDHALERSVIARADRVVFVSRLDAERYAELHGHPRKMVTIPNGFDEADFEALPDEPRHPSRFTLMHVGSVGRDRNPEQLYHAIRRLSERGVVTPERFRLVLVGSVEPSVIESYRRAGIEPYVELVPYVPHGEAIRLARSAHALLLLVQSRADRNILPGKTFEYLRHGRPVLALGPPGGELSRVLAETEGGEVIDYEDVRGMEAKLEDWMGESPVGRALRGANAEALDRFSRRTLTGRLAEVLSEVIA